MQHILTFKIDGRFSGNLLYMWCHWRPTQQHTFSISHSQW